MISESERREVARKIREYVNAYGDKIEDAEMVLLGTVWCRGEFNEVVRPISEAELLAMVADLIDPTCRFFPTFNGGFGCDRCYTWFQSMETKPNYCPSCGARVVDDE